MLLNMEKIIPKPLSNEERFLREVYLVAEQSRDPRTKIGAIIVKDGDIISSGFNNFPRKVKDLESRYLDKELKRQFVVHAEANAVHNCARKGMSCLGGIMYTQGVPCSECAKVIIQGGISKVIIHNEWPHLNNIDSWRKSNDLTLTMFKEAGVVIESIAIKLNLLGHLDGERISV
jgi:dCMP deaminase